MISAFGNVQKAPFAATHAKLGGYAQASATINYKKENSTYEVQAQTAGGRTARFTTLERRSVQTDSSAQPTIYINSGDGTSPFESASLSDRYHRAGKDALTLAEATEV